MTDCERNRARFFSRFILFLVLDFFHSVLRAIAIFMQVNYESRHTTRFDSDSVSFEIVVAGIFYTQVNSNIHAHNHNTKSETTVANPNV